MITEKLHKPARRYIGGHNKHRIRRYIARFPQTTAGFRSQARTDKSTCTQQRDSGSSPCASRRRKLLSACQLAQTWDCSAALVHVHICLRVPYIVQFCSASQHRSCFSFTSVSYWWQCEILLTWHSENPHQTKKHKSNILSSPTTSYQSKLFQPKCAQIKMTCKNV